MYTIDYLRSRRVWFEEILHSPASSSTKLAHSVHVPGCRVAKTVLVKAGDRSVLAVLPSTCRVDLGRLSETLGMPPQMYAWRRLMNSLASSPTASRGSYRRSDVLYELETVFDESLVKVAELVFGGNTRHEGLRMRSDDYIAIEGPVIGSFAVPIVPRRTVRSRSQSDRRAG